MFTHPLENRSKMKPQDALDMVMAGNQRFLDGKAERRDYPDLIKITKNEQQPFVSVLSCSDSRVPVELVFDQAIGDLFSIRLAGNIATDKGIGSLEYGSKYTGVKLIVVLGHEGCGAVKAACDDFKDGHIGEIVNLIKPCIRHECTVEEDRSSKNADFVQKVCEHNVQHQIDVILRQSDILDSMVKEKKVAIVGAVYDTASGKVNFLEDTFVGLS